MGKVLLNLGFLAALFGYPLAAQEAVVWDANPISMPAPIDSNSPAFWRDGRLFWFGSNGAPWLSEGPDQFGPWDMHDVDFRSDHPWTHWIESVWPEDNGVVWSWYHTEPHGLVPDSTLTVPKIGAAVSFDGGKTMRDIGVVLESDEPLDPTAQNGYFAGGHGDFTVILNPERTYFYFFFDNYGGPVETQGVCVARMAFEDRFKPVGKVWKYFNGGWQEPGRGGRVTPIFPARKGWQGSAPDSMWGPSVHWNTYLKCFVMLLNHAAGEPGWTQEGIYVSYCSDLTRPESWLEPRKILDNSQFPGWFYPQVMGLDPGDTDRRAGQTARLYVGGISQWEITFVAPAAAPAAVKLSAVPASGSIAVGESAVLSVSATGTGPFTYQWFKDGVLLPQATVSTYSIPASTIENAGVYTVVVSNDLGAATSDALTLVVTAAVDDVPPLVTPAPASAAFLSNLSVRSRLLSESSDLIVGFFVQSSGITPLALRAIGPTLANFGLSEPLADPRLELFNASGVKIAENDDWMADDKATFASLGAFALPIGSADSAIVIDMAPGAGTARVTGTTAGVTLVEIYDAIASAESRIVNISARAEVGVGDAVMIGGFSLAGRGTKRLLIRALGPGLADYGVGYVLDDPTLKVYQGGTAPIAQSNNWDTALEPVFTAAGASVLPRGSRDSAVVVTASAGKSYTAVVSSASGMTGEAMLEIFELP